MNSPQRILVTAALPYANGPIHLGHLAGAYLPADIYVRYQRLRKRDVLFICGSDEHGVAITLSAEKEHASAQSIVDRYHALNKEAFARFGVSFDNYSRTSLPLHHQTALAFLLSFYRGGILREKQEKQFYDQKAGMFLPDRYVSGTCPVCGNTDARGDQCERCGTFLDPMQLKDPRSSITGETPVVRETTHLYFPLGVYQSRLEAYIRESNEREPWKENVLQYCRGWFKEGLQDRAVTRDLDWGVKIPIPGYENKVIYVWFDAVLGYVSSTIEWAQRAGRAEAWKQYWLNPDTKYVAFIGKDNVVFHTIVFPAMLMAWNDQNQAEQYVLPANVPANEFLNFEGQKFSKSRGWGIDVQDFLAKYPADPLRYYLAVNLPEYRDSDFTWRDFQAKNNNELADILGNFVNRTLAFAARTFENAVPRRGALEAIDRDIVGVLEQVPSRVAELWERYRFRDGLMEAMNLARAANKYFNDSEPWKTAKTDPVRCATTINISIQLARALAILMSPVIPGSCQGIWRMLRLEGEVSGQRWESAGDLPVPDGHRLGKAEILFTKIEDEVIEKELQSLGQPPVPAAATAVSASERPQIALEDFKKIDLRVAKVLSCEKVPKSEKLLKLQLEVGKDQRQVLAGIAQHYQPADLVGKLVVVVYNLQPAKLMGQESQGMLLAASDETGRLVFVSPSAEIQSGAVIR
ncbi:MAG TPA: methionine--tRNA ligase [Bacteroidota bacterium]|nr:methionine--tRNA ligase [Bacteroidota bacterium]